jgi:hypothetical protein
MPRSGLPIPRIVATQGALCLWGSILAVFFLLYGILFGALHIETYTLVLNSGPVRWQSSSLDPTGALELRWRMLWGLSALASVAIALVVAITSIELMVRYRLARSPLSWLVLALVATALVTVTWIKGYGGNASNQVLDLYSDNAHVRLSFFIQLMTVVGLTVVVLVAGGLAALLRREEPMDVAAITHRHQDFRRSLMGCTVLLVAFTIETYFLFRLATVGLDPDVAGPVATTLTVGGGVSYTCLLLVLYGPAAVALNRWSWSVAAQEVGSFELPKLQKWLQDHGIDISPMHVASGAMLTCLPAIVGASINFLPRIF